MADQDGEPIWVFLKVILMKSLQSVSGVSGQLNSSGSISGISLQLRYLRCSGNGKPDTDGSAGRSGARHLFCLISGSGYRSMSY